MPSTSRIPHASREAHFTPSSPATSPLAHVTNTILPMAQTDSHGLDASKLGIAPRVVPQKHLPIPVQQAGLPIDPEPPPSNPESPPVSETQTPSSPPPGPPIAGRRKKKKKKPKGKTSPSAPSGCHAIPSHNCIASGCVTTTHEHGHRPVVNYFTSQSTTITFTIAATNAGPTRFRKLDERFACLHHYLDVIAEPAEILVSLNTPFRRHPIDDRHGNARYQTISHPNWKQIAPPIPLAVQSRAVIFLNNRLSENFDVTVFPDIPDVDVLHVTLTEKPTHSRACHNCRSTTIEIPMTELYANRTHHAWAEYEAHTVNKCECVEFADIHNNSDIIEVNEPYNNTIAEVDGPQPTRKLPYLPPPEILICQETPTSSPCSPEAVALLLETPETARTLPTIIIPVPRHRQCKPHLPPLLLEADELLPGTTMMGLNRHYQLPPYHQCRRACRSKRRPYYFGGLIADIMPHVLSAFSIWSFGCVPWDIH